MSQRTARILVLLPALLLAAAAPPPEPDPRTTAFTVRQLAPDLHLLQGTGGNVLAFVGPEGTVLVDVDHAEAHGKLREVLRAFGADRVTHVIDTHYHLDHAGGNAPFAAEGATILAHAAARDRLKAGASVTVGPAVQIIPPTSEPGLPSLVTDCGFTLHRNGAAIRATHHAGAHTDGDLVVQFPASKVVHMGDIFVRYGFPFIDVPGGGRIDATIRAVERVLATAAPDTRFIPGHGDVATAADLRAYLDMLKGTRAAVADAMAKGRSLEQIKADRVLAPWEKANASYFVPADFFIETIHRSISIGAAADACSAGL